MFYLFAYNFTDAWMGSRSTLTELRSVNEQRRQHVESHVT